MRAFLAGLSLGIIAGAGLAWFWLAGPRRPAGPVGVAPPLIERKVSADKPVQDSPDRAQSSTSLALTGNPRDRIGTRNRAELESILQGLRGIGSRYLKFLRKKFQDPASRSAEIQALRDDANQYLVKLERMYGLEGPEVLYSPVGSPYVLLGFVEASEFPLRSDQVAGILSILQDGERKLEQVLGSWGDLSSLERIHDSLALETECRSGILRLLEPEQRALFDLPDQLWGRCTCSSFLLRGPGGPAAASRIAEEWNRTLGANDIQARELAFSADEYVKAYDSAMSELERRRSTGESVNWREQELTVMQIMIELKKRIAPRLYLTESQRKTFNDWATLYQISE